MVIDEVLPEMPAVGRTAGEARYRALFDAIDQGFCIIEMLFAADGRPYDYRFLETNAAFAAQTGLDDAVGRTMRALKPDHEQHWFDMYGRIAVTRQAVRFEQQAAALHRWYEVYAFPVDAPELRRVGVLFNDVSERRRAQERLSLLAAEVDHRAKNMLALVAGMVRLTQADTVPEFRKAVAGRIAALANSQRALSEGRAQSAELAQLVKGELAPYYGEGEGRVRIAGPAVTLSAAAAQPVAMAVHELAANAAKHGALSVAEGEVSLTWWRRDDGWLVLCWRESGGPPAKPSAREGTGTRIITGSIRGQLGGDVRFDWRREGLLCELTVPVGK